MLRKPNNLKLSSITMSDSVLKLEIEKTIYNLHNCACKEVNAVLGLDGFVDKILEVVNTIYADKSYDRIELIDNFGERIKRAAGLSSNFQLVPKYIKIGGDGPILCNSLIALGVKTMYIGAAGESEINPIFKPMSEKCKLISLCDPSYTYAIEFSDGKLIFSELENFNYITWENIEKSIGLDALGQIVKDANLIGFENWTMIPSMSDIWKQFIEKVLPYLKLNDRTKLAFFDLSDPEKRTAGDIAEAISIIQRFSSFFKVILGLNYKEAVEILTLLCGDGNYKGIDLNELVERIAEKLNIYCVVVHPVKEAAAFANGKYYCTDGLYTKNPAITTGAGDNFNAGFCFGQTLGLDIEDSLILGVGVSGYYVRNAKSPSKDELFTFLNEWKDSL